MPINGMMTLNDVVDAGQQGVQWQQQQQQQKIRQEQQQRDLDAQKLQDQADAAATSVVDKSKAEWALNGAQGNYTPNDSTMLQAAEARGMTFAKGGDWKNFFKNEAAVQGQRQRVRAQALQQYGVDGNIDALVRSTYPTMFDGKQIAGTETIPGSGTNPDGTPASSQLKIKFDDGTTETVQPDQVVRRLKMTLIDPQQQAIQDAKLNFLLAQEKIKGDQARETETVKGDQARKTETVKAGDQLTLAGVNNGAAQKRVDTSSGATLAAANIRAAATKAAAATTAGPKNEVAGLTAAEKWQTMAKNHFGTISGGLMGSTRMSGQATLDLAAAAQRIFEANPGKLTESQALDKAAQFLKLTSPAGGIDSLMSAGH